MLIVQGLRQESGAQLREYDSYCRMANMVNEAH